MITTSKRLYLLIPRVFDFDRYVIPETGTGHRQSMPLFADWEQTRDGFKILLRESLEYHQKHLIWTFLDRCYVCPIALNPCLQAIVLEPSSLELIREVFDDLLLRSSFTRISGGSNTSSAYIASILVCRLPGSE
jgi:hypothetical protein